MLRRISSAIKLCCCHFLKRPVSLGEKMDLLFTANPDPWRFESSPYEKDKYERTIGLIPRRDFTRILEVGCAEGVFTRRLAPYGATVLACDVSEVALGRAKERCRGFPHVEFRCFDLLEGELEGAFDLICAGEVLYFLDDLDAIRQARDRLIAHLEPGGYFLLCHMRLKKEETDGSGRTPLSGHPTMGATSIHRLFIETDGLAHVERILEPGYIIDLLQKEPA